MWVNVSDTRRQRTRGKTLEVSITAVNAEQDTFHSHLSLLNGVICKALQAFLPRLCIASGCTPLDPWCLNLKGGRHKWVSMAINFTLVDPEPLVQSRNGRAVLISE